MKEDEPVETDQQVICFGQWSPSKFACFSIKQNFSGLPPLTLYTNFNINPLIQDQEDNVVTMKEEDETLDIKNEVITCFIISRKSKEMVENWLFGK